MTGWNPNVKGTVHALAVSGSTVYLGGDFSGPNSINGNTTRNHAAAVDATTGTVTSWDADVNDTVNTLALSGATVDLGGKFHGTNSINGSPVRNYAAVVDSTNGIVEPRDPDLPRAQRRHNPAAAHAKVAFVVARR